MTEQPGNDYQSAGENWLKNRGAADINFEKLNRYYAQTSKVSYKPPISAQDMEQFPERNYGIPDDWDYKTSDLGPNGEDKPAGAVGWTPQGEPWYGTDNALSEWSKGVFNNIFSKSNENYRNMQQERFNAVTEFLTLNWDDAHQSMDEARAYKQEYKDWKSGQKEQGEKVKAFGGQGVGKTVSGTLGQTIMGLGQVMDVAAQSAERIVGGMQQLEEVADLSSMGEAPSLVNLAEGKHEAAIEKLPRWAQKPAEFVRGFVETFDLIDLTWDGLRAANVLFGGEGLDKKQKGFSILKDDWEAGRIAYTSWINPAIKEEFTRRYEQGENPYLLQLELENPWAELAGELILDPLNVIGAFNKAGKTAKAVKTNKASWFRTVGETLYNKFKDIEDVTKLEDWTEIANETSKNMKKVSQGLSDLGNDMRLSALATSGKRSFVADMVGQSVSWVAGTVEKSLGLQGTEKIEKIVEVMKFVTNLASDDPEIVADALKNLGSMHKSGFPMKVFLSDGMMNTAYILKEFGGDAKTWDNIKDALNGVGEIEKFNDLLNKRVSSAVNKLFPSLAQRVEAGEKLTNFGQAMLRVENFANSKPMRGINSFFAHVYMGMSPGYAARNMITNFIHVINDEGLAAFKGNPFRVQHFEDELIDIFGQIPKAAERAQGAADTKAAEGFMRIFGLGLEAGREGERRSSIRVYAAATKRVLKNMLQEGKRSFFLNTRKFNIAMA